MRELSQNNDMLAYHFKSKFDQHFGQQVVWSRLTSNLEMKKLGSSEAYLLKLGKNLSWDRTVRSYLQFFVKMRY